MEPTREQIKEFVAWAEQYLNSLPPEQQKSYMTTLGALSGKIGFAALRNVIRPQNSGNPAIQQLWNQWWVGIQGNPPPLTQDVFNLSSTNPYQIRYISPPPDSADIFAQTGESTYIDRVTEYLNYLMYQGALTPQNRAQLGNTIAEKINSGAKLEDLPFFDILTRPDFPQYADYFVKQQKEAQKLNQQYLDTQLDWGQQVADFQKDEAARLQWEEAQKQTTLLEGKRQYGIGVKAGIGNLRDTEMGLGLARSIMGEPVVTKPTPELEGITEGEFAKYLAGLSPAQKSYYTSRPEVAISEDVIKARQEWWSTLQAGVQQTELEKVGASLGQMYKEREVLRRQLPEFGGNPMGIAQKYDPTSLVGQIAMTTPERLQRINEKIRDYESQANYIVGEEARGSIESYPQPSKIDPLLQHLKEFPYQAKFYEQTPRQRGYYSRTYTPRARWMTG